jgi:hypothetical protein
MAVHDKALAAATAQEGAAAQPTNQQHGRARDYAKEENDAYAKLQAKRREVRTNSAHYTWGG